ncbi:MAG: TlpA family protein disulfide reductase [Planctomycetes bacterium]|nr:TlpA family protein disulfide reductase [Planctomycetota bacterium]
MWQRKFEQYRQMGFTVVGIALDAEGIAPAKLYYERFGVTFPALVDPNYATGFGAVPKTFFVDEQGVVRELRGWEGRLKPKDQLRPVTARIRRQWSKPETRLDPAAIAGLANRHEADPTDLATAVELASRYLDLKLNREARGLLQRAVNGHDARTIARSADAAKSRLLGQAYFQLSRASVGNRDAQVKHATLSFYLNPSVGYGKQIARIIAPEKFDGRPQGDFDNRFREGTLRRLRQERQEWLAGK